ARRGRQHELWARLYCRLVRRDAGRRHCVIQRPASRYIAREMAISGAINGALSIAFFLAVVGTDGPLPIWDLRNFALDLWPQSFAIGLMAALIPGLLCRRTIRRGALRSIDG